METKRVKQVRIREEYDPKLRELAKLVQDERGLFSPHLGLAVETAIEEALKCRKQKERAKTRKSQ